MSGPLRIVVTGTESTGKTELARQLAAHFEAPWAAEYVREFWDAHQGVRAEDLDAIARGQIANEDAAIARAGRVAFFDTDLVSCVLWNDLLFPGACPAWVRAAAEQRSRAVALYLLCEADVPFAPDPQRCFPDEAARDRTSALWRETLRARGVRVIKISGEWAARTQLAIAAVQQVLDR